MKNVDDVTRNADDITESATKNADIAGSKVNADTVFSGHGSYIPDRGTGVIPDGTSLTVYSKSGGKITNTLGNAIEHGDDLSHVYKKTYSAGDSFPDYILHDGVDLNIQGNPVTVSKDTPLSELLKSDMGDCHWAACTYNPYEGASNLIYHTEGVVDSSAKKFIKIYDKK